MVLLSTSFLIDARNRLFVLHVPTCRRREDNFLAFHLLLPLRQFTPDSIKFSLGLHLRHDLVDVLFRFVPAQSVFSIADS